LIVPDTYATGRSAEAALNRLFSSGLIPERVILYGFIAIPALVRLGEFCSREGIEMFSFAICDLTQLAFNNYDMPLYGFDESSHASTGRRIRLGSIVDMDTLDGMIPHYVAGLDQPGDWSERQVSLFNGYGMESGDVVGHLRKSTDLIKSCSELHSGEVWYDGFHEGIAMKELARLETVLRDFARDNTHVE
jgi:hypothetical protein